MRCFIQHYYILSLEKLYVNFHYPQLIVNGIPLEIGVIVVKIVVAVGNGDLEQ